MAARREHPTVTAATLRPAEQPTLYFVGVSTGHSSIQEVFPAWARELGLVGARLQGVDLPLHAPPQDYRAVVEHIGADPLSLGALVTTHKIDLYRAASDLFDVTDDLARLMGETSCLFKGPQGLVCHAKDPVSSGLALGALLPEQHFAHTGAEVLCMGAGGSTVAISWYLSRPSRGADRPGRIRVTDRSQPRLDHLARVHAAVGTDTPVDGVLVTTAADNDQLAGALPPGSLVVNATGLGKDAPGSPLSSGTRFPEDGLAWDLNYRGDLVFLDQARTQARERRLSVHDGWVYFLHGWLQVIGEVFHTTVPTTGPGFDVLSEMARAVR